MGRGVSANVFNQNLINYNENNVDMRKGLMNEEINNYDNYEYRENLDNIENQENIENNQQIKMNENMQENIDDVNNIHSNIEIFEDVNNHIEEMINDQENYKDDLNY